MPAAGCTFEMSRAYYADHAPGAGLVLNFAERAANRIARGIGLSAGTRRRSENALGRYSNRRASNGPTFAARLAGK